MRNTSVQGICARMTAVRREHYGERGRSEFAKQLGIRPSTYTHYELDRIPPATLLHRAARLTGTRLEWLILGEGERYEMRPSPIQSLCERLSSRLHHVLSERPEHAAYAESLIEMLERMARPEGAAPFSESRPRVAELIPVVGSTSAGTARYWKELSAASTGAITDALLESKLAECTSIGPWQTGHWDGEAGSAVSLIQLSEPDERGILEFITAPHIKQRHPRSVAWRIDGDSMSPRYLDRDIVLTSPDAPAISGHPCVARQRGQIGVNCKIYQLEGRDVLLIPINSSLPPQRVPAEDIEWAWRVVGAVRLSTT